MQEPPRNPPATDDPAATNPAASVDAAGVDLTLIRWMLAIPPRERLRVLQRYINSARRLRDAGRAAR